MSATMRTADDRCPGAWRRHEAVDGTLARFRPVGGALHATELDLLAGAVATGGAPLEITSRASLQVRGLDASAADALADALRSARPEALLDEQGRELVCGLLGPTRSGVLDDEVARVATGLRGRPEVPGRVLVAVDLPADPHDRPRADVAVVVHPHPPAVRGDGAGHIGRAALWLDGPDGEVDSGIRHDDPAVLALAALDAFVDERGRAWRIREVPDGVARVARAVRARLGADPTPPPIPDPIPDPIPTPEPCPAPVTGVVLEVAPRLGEITPAAAAAVRELLDAGATLRVTPERTLVLRGLADAGAARSHLAEHVETDPRSPWWGVSACVGAPRCAKSWADVRGDLAAAVHRGRAGGHGEHREHWVGCARGCGTPEGPVVLTVAEPTHDRTTDCTTDDSTDRTADETTVAYRTEQRSGRVIG